MRFGELDPYRHVNHAVYLAYFEAGRVDALAAVGMGLDRLQADDVALVVSDLRVRFLAPAFLGEALVVESGISDFGRARASWFQRVRRGDEVLVTQVLRSGCTDLSGRIRRFPDGLVDALRPLALPVDWLGNAAPR